MGFRFFPLSPTLSLKDFLVPDFVPDDVYPISVFFVPLMGYFVPLTGYFVPLTGYFVK